MGVGAVSQHYSKSFCMDRINEKHEKSFPHTLLPEFQVSFFSSFFFFFIDPALNNAAYLVTISGKKEQVPFCIPI